MAAVVTPRRVLVALVAVLLANAFLLFGDLARAVSVEDALEDFRHGEHLTTPPLPAAGVYVYDTAGSERVDRLGIHRAYPPVTTRTVRAHGCGVRETVTVFREHVETYDVCADGVRDVAFATRLSYYLVPSAMSLTCGRGGSRVAASSYACAGDGTDASVTVTDEGVGSIEVEEVEVPCRRVVVTTVLRGANAGGARRALCTDPRTGLVLTEDRVVGVSYRSGFVGRVTYTERATFRIRSLVPLT
ncbi:MAG TPA: hypothetical protein VGX28_07155 [Frankiaceae bacterium]|jgi:hypothetical protein|nr:hypothetical protein [Frankiaceae bacterium]